MKSHKQLRIKEIDDHIERMDFAPVLDSQVRQVRWLYHNSNKCTMVYEEKLVRLIAFKLNNRVMELENELASYKQEYELLTGQPAR